MELFRPTGLTEMLLVRDSGWRAWPPRLPDQPIFYPVMTYEYAEKIARDWNSSQAEPDNLGFVMAFAIDAERSARYPVHLAGGRDHAELWVPADELEYFNDGITGFINVVAAFRKGVRLNEEEMHGLVS